MPISSRLICNRASLKTKPKRVKEIVDRLSVALQTIKNKGE